VALTSAALLVVTWPRTGASGEKPVSGAAYALLSGLAFGFCLNAFRQAGHALEPNHPIFAAVVTLMIVQIAQTLALEPVPGDHRPRGPGRRGARLAAVAGRGVLGRGRLGRLVHRPGPGAGRAGEGRRGGRGAHRRPGRTPLFAERLTSFR
jgi:hypothetical protein